MTTEVALITAVNPNFVKKKNGSQRMKKVPYEYMLKQKKVKVRLNKVAE